MNKFVFIVLAIFSVNSCTSEITTPDKHNCYIVYDAGSSGTRLYIYEQSGADLISHEGPKVSALADPIRHTHGKDLSDLDTITDEVASALDLIKLDGPLEEGKPNWSGFDWSKQCEAQSVKVFATAGMRIAEQNNPTDSIVLWQTLASKITAKVGPNVTVETRTLTGFEEGLFAWLSVKDVHTTDEPSSNYGIVEMGGASSQVTFPCPNCDSVNDAVKTVIVDGNPMQIYSYSYLGLGQDEAPHSLPFTVAGQVPKSCSYGVGTNNPDWTIASCAVEIPITAKGSNTDIIDPYNYTKTGTKGTTNTLPAAHKNIPKWYLMGAFNYAKETDIDDFCVNQHDGYYNAFTACFNPIYLDKYLKTLDIQAEQSSKVDVSWTQGAAICQIENCLATITTPPVCRWMKSGCLAH
ncbi:nucleoside phosphatase [Paraglaciecola sp. 2405UD69-4]|uniref:nucleoside phosphatase n=1 Tax=Paraglaciecola sp. 2405UD69-4 TaxID=3391836 RepID=UPI0039C94064